MRPVEARYEDGILKLEKPLPLRPGECVGIILIRRPDPARWDLARIAAVAGNEDVELSTSGLDDWTENLHREDAR